MNFGSSSIFLSSNIVILSCNFQGVDSSFILFCFQFEGEGVEGVEGEGEREYLMNCDCVSDSECIG